jgi:hypothetical protein
MVGVTRSKYKYGWALPRSLCAAAVLVASLASPHATADPVVIGPPLGSLGNRTILLEQDFTQLESLAGYRLLVGRKATTGIDNPVGTAPSRLLAVRPSPTTQNAFDVPELDEQSDAAAAAVSVKDVLRSVVNLRAGTATAQQRAVPLDDDDVYFDLRRYLLENQTVGAMLQAVVDPLASEDGTKSFSILGYGRWVVENDANAGLRVTETNSGSTTTIASTERAGGDDGAQPAPARGPQGNAVRSTRAFIIATLIDYASSPVGMFVLIVGGWILLFAVAAKLVITVRPRRF